MNANCKMQQHHFSLTHGLLTFFGIERSNISRLREFHGHTTVRTALTSDWEKVSGDIHGVFVAESQNIEKEKCQLDACQSK